MYMKIIESFRRFSFSSSKAKISDALKTISRLSNGRLPSLAVVATCVTAYVGYTQTPNVPWYRARYCVATSRVKPQHFDSVREQELAQLKAIVNCSRGNNFGSLLEDSGVESFLVIRGPKGVGKTMLINKALENTRGVLTIDNIRAGVNQDEIVKEALRLIVGPNIKDEHLKESADRVIAAYISAFGKQPLVVIRAAERDSRKEFAEVPQAARLLVTRFRLRVLVDASDNSLPHALTKRERNVEIEPMSNAQMLKLEQCKNLVQFLKDKDALDVVLAVCGGSPLELINLSEKWGSENNDVSKMQVVEKFVEYSIALALNKLGQFYKLDALMSDKLKQELALFKDKNELVENDISVQLPDIKGILRHAYRRSAVSKDGIEKPAVCVVPADGAMSIVLRAGLITTNQYDYDEIKALVKKL